MKRPTVLIADDHRAVAEALELTLGKWFDVTGIVLTLEDLEQMLTIESPSAVVLDLAFKHHNALERLKHLKGMRPGTRFIVFTASNDRVLVDVARKAGASGFVVKESSTTELQLAINEALAGREYISPSLRPGGKAPLGAKRNPSALRFPSARQMEVLALMHEGLSQREAAVKLGVTRKDVEYHIREAGKRLGFGSVALLVRWYEEQLNKPTD